MAKYRKLPFGYFLMDGMITIDEKEAAVVKEIFHKYLSGGSYLGIAKLLNASGVQYSNSEWNKNNVGRILKNEKYIGDAQFSQIIDISQFEEVRVKIDKLWCRESIAKNQNLKGIVFCQNCNYPMNNRSGRWKCLKCNCKSRYNNEEFLNNLLIRIMVLIRNIDTIEIPKFEPFATTLGIKRMGNEINRELDKMSVDEEKITKLLIELSNEKYKACDDDSKARCAKKIIERLEDVINEDQVDIDLLKEIADKIIIDFDGDFFMQLKNGQKI